MLFFLYGQDIWSKKQKIQQITQEFVKKVDPSRMNLLILESGQVDDEQVRAVITASPFMARKRMIVLKNIITQVRRKALLADLLDILQNLKEHTMVVVSEDGEKPKKWSNQSAQALWEFLEKHAKTEIFRPVWGAKLNAEIGKMTNKMGVKINPEASELLALLSGGDLGNIDKELEKLSAYCSDVIKIEDVKLLCLAQGEANIFEFLDALGGKKPKVLLSLFVEQLKENDPIALIIRIVGQLRGLLAIKMQGQAGARTLHLHPFQAKKISAQIRNWDISTLKHFMFELMMLDYGVKQGFIADSATKLSTILVKFSS